MTSQCGPRRPNLNETKVRRRYDVACRVGTYLFMMFFITSFFSISPLHVRWLLPYIIKNNSSSTNNEGLILDQCNGKIKLITHLCYPFRTNYRSSHQRCSIKKGVLRNFARFTGEHRPEACNFIQKETLA